ncbi:hypothetical protein [Nocardia farcinica]|uniref:hypothetical protein n=1 Tax=Nocardia farcinica TaxID=37329 RepID=UPI0022BA0442|nr:hypothetical protein [Nocardia farcinica]MCZ9326515.1 hypothetical protein [Nocardia farcinica]
MGRIQQATIVSESGHVRGLLRTLPDDMHVTTEMVAEFYEVGRETVLTVVKRNRDEFEADGYRVVTRSAFLSMMGDSDIASLSSANLRELLRTVPSAGATPRRDAAAGLARRSTRPST